MAERRGFNFDDYLRKWMTRYPNEPYLLQKILGTYGMTPQEKWLTTQRFPGEPTPTEPTSAEPTSAEGQLNFPEGATLQQLQETLQRWLGEGTITEEQAADYFDQGVSQYLNQYTSEKDLSDRINQLGVDRQTATELYNDIRFEAGTGELDIRGARGRAIGVEEETEKARQEAYFTREQTTRELTPVMNRLQESPFLSEEEKAGFSGEAGEKLIDMYLGGQSREVGDYLNALEQRTMDRYQSEIQTAQAQAEVAGRMKPPEEPEWERPLIPRAEKVVKPFLEETGLGEGTRLRSFIESKLPGMVAETRGARQEWWKRMHPEPEPEEVTLASEQARYGREAREWGGVFESASREPLVGGVFSGPGGLKGIALQAYRSAQAKLAGLRPEDYPTLVGRKPPTPEEDPLQKALKRRKFLPEYYRQPGAGLVSRLTPAVRF